MASVAVLMSTYNGEKYLREQIDSVLNQKGVQVSLLVRDDGSKDHTLELLQEYAQEHENISWYNNVNLGPAKSFLDLVMNAPEADYYAFCDQDDYWDEDKLAIAVEKMKDFPADKPALYYSNLRIVDQDLNFFRLSHAVPHVPKNRYSVLAEPIATGCTMVFNAATVKVLRRKLPEYCSMHDAWVYMVCLLLGSVVYDFDAHISYRQHGNNVIGTHLKQNPLKLFYQRFIRLFDRNLQPRYKNAQNFMDCFGDLLSEPDRKKVEKMVHYKDSFFKRMGLFFDPDICGSTLSRDVRYRLLVLAGLV